MEPGDVVMSINTIFCLPLTILVICCMCRVVRRYQFPVICYTYLLISNLIQFCTHIVWLTKFRDHQTQTIHLIVFYFGVLASVYFKMCIALERYIFIACPLLDCIRQTKGSVLVCVLIWVFCIITAPLAILLDQFVRILFFSLFPAPLFIFCLAGTIKALPAATSVPPEEKRRIVGILVLLVLNYFLMIFPRIICLILRVPDPVVLISFLLSPFVDLIVYVFMRKGPIDKLLACLCFSMDNTAGDVAADHQV